LFEQAVNLEPAKRGPWIEQACNGNARIRAELLSLLEHDVPGDSFLETLIDSLTGHQMEVVGCRLAAGSQIDSWTVIKKIGCGGMGEIYLAERTGKDDPTLRQVAAVKLIRSSADMERLRKRFKAERRIVAGLNHPAIARLLESGVLEDGTPYFALDYVEGQPIDRYCQSLDLKSRLEVFCKVCEAVAYAHRNLVVHCDLKPSNILVSDDGMPHLLDFGIARLLADAGDNGYQTQTLWPCSIRYSSPEQIRNGIVTTATDVFALGIILCELVSGTHPFDPDGTSGGFDVIERIYRGEPKIRFAQTQRSSWAARQLIRELELIIRKALTRKPEARYSSVEYLIDDIQCCLERRPISIRGNQVLYRFQKLIQRHPGTAVASAVATLLAAAALATTLWYGNVVQRESDYAREQRRLAVLSAQTMIDDFATALETLSAPAKSRLELLKKVSAIFDRLQAREPAGRFATEQEIAQVEGSIRTMLRLAAVLLDLGDRGEALAKVSEAETLARELQNAGASRERGGLLLAEVLIAKGQILRDDANREAANCTNEALQNLQVLDAQKEKTNREKLELLLCRATTLKGDLLTGSTSDYEAERLLKRAVSHGEAIYARHPDDTEVVDAYATALQDLGSYYDFDYKEDLAREPIERSLAIRRMAVDKSPRDARLRSQLEAATAAWSDVASRANGKDRDGSIRRSLDQSIGDLRKRCEDDPDNFDAGYRLMRALHSSGTYETYNYNPKAAISLFEEERRIGTALSARRAKDPRLDRDLFETGVALSHCYSEVGNPDAARQIDVGELEPLAKSLEADSKDEIENWERRGRVSSARLEVAVATRDWPEARVYAAQALDAWQKCFEKKPDPFRRQLFGAGLANLGECYGFEGSYDEACQYLGSGLLILRDMLESGGQGEHSRLASIVSEAEDALRLFRSMRPASPSVSYIPFLTTEIDP
jgi:tRNA A-37 threonylcarbamoyl transferase component Bud32/tetratricopeptide (TPR) repeat protein